MTNSKHIACASGRKIPLHPRPRFWSKQGTVKSVYLGRFDMTPGIASRMETYELHRYRHVNTGDGPGHSMVEAELRWRENWPARFAIVISTLSLITAFAALAID